MTAIQQRVIRAKDAPKYLGMNRDIFNQLVRPYITTIPIGAQGVGFDRLELDAWLEHYKQCNGRPGASIGEALWDANEPPDSISVTGSGISTSKSEVAEFAKVLEKSISQRRKNTSPRKRRK